MRKTLFTLLALALVGLLFITLSTYFTGVPAHASFKKAFIVVFENVEADQVLTQPTFSSLAQQGAYMNNFHAITHPSQPNYIAMTSADTHGVSNDKPVDLEVKNIIDLLEAKGISWKVYAEDYPGNCDPSETLGKYVRRHNPFISYNNIRNNAKRCANIVNAEQLVIDIKSENLPDFSFYIPNTDNNGHDTGIVFADNWLNNTLVPYLNEPAFIQDMLFIITFDEGNNKHPTPQNQIYTLFYGDMVNKTIIQDRYTLYSLLRTLEDEWELGTLELNDATSPAISGIFKSD